MAYIKEGVCRCKPSYAGNGAVCGNDKVSIRKTYIFIYYAISWIHKSTWGVLKTISVNYI